MLCGSHIIWNLAYHMKKMKQRISIRHLNSFQFFINKSIIFLLFVLFFHVVCKISNFNICITFCSKLLVSTWLYIQINQLNSSLRFHLNLWLHNLWTSLLVESSSAGGTMPEVLTWKLTMLLACTVHRHFKCSRNMHSVQKVMIFSIKVYC